jgi:hypothetical protein
MAVAPDVAFPVTVRFDDGESESYSNVRELELNLEDFDSSVDRTCDVRDANGRQLFLQLKLLRLVALRLAE